jgi:hypothetical protein
LEILKLLYWIYRQKHQHFISVSSKTWRRWRIPLSIIVILNPNYKFFVIHRKKYKSLKNFVVIGLKWNGKNVKRRTTGFAKEYIKKNRGIKCVYCECDITEDNATTDHIIPISKGGNNSQVNLMICCFDCNNERGNDEFKQYLRKKNPKYRTVRIPYV